MIRYIKYSLLITALIYLTCYLFGVIYHFELYNPFAWILEIPKWKGAERIALFLGILFYQAGNLVAISGANNDDKFGFCFFAYIIALCSFGIILGI